MHDFKITFLTERKSDDELYAERMAKTIYRGANEPRPKSEAQRRYEERDLYPKTYEAYLERPMPTNWKANPYAITTDEAVGVRPFDPKEVSHIEAIRRRSKNTQGDFLSEGLTSAENRRDEAKNAFMVSPGLSVNELTDEQRDLITALSGYTDPPLPIDEPKQSMIERFKAAFKRKSKDEINKESIAYALYKSMGGRDEDL